MKLEYYGSVKDGVLTIRNRKQMQSDLKHFEGKDVEILIQRKKRARSIPLNKYYWGVVVALVAEKFRDLGHEVDSQLTHEYLKVNYNYTELIDMITGEVSKVPASTANLSNTKFLEYVERIKKFAAEKLDLYIPDPNEQLQLIS